MQAGQRDDDVAAESRSTGDFDANAALRDVHDACAEDGAVVAERGGAVELDPRHPRPRPSAGEFSKARTSIGCVERDADQPLSDHWATPLTVSPCLSSTETGVPDGIGE